MAAFIISLVLFSANALTAFPQFDLGELTNENRMRGGDGGGRMPFGFGLGEQEEEVVDEKDVKACDTMVAIFEIYNATQLALTDIRNAVPNVTFWNGGMASIMNRNFGEPPEFAEENMDMVHTADMLELDDNNNSSITASSNVTFEVVLVGVPPNDTESFTEVLNKTGIEFQDMEDQLCVQFINETSPQTAGPIPPRVEPEFPNMFSIPAHITTILYPNIFYNILIDAPEASMDDALPTTTTTKAPFSIRTANPFSYYISLDSTTGLIKLDHGNIPNDPSNAWAWILTNSSNDADTVDDKPKYNLVNQKTPNAKVIMGTDGALTVSDDQTSNTEGLTFSLSLSNPDGFTIWTATNNETFCVVQYFAVTLRLMPVSSPENRQAHLCTRFRLQLEEVSVVSGRHNITFVDLYSSQNSEWMDLEQVENIDGKEIIVSSVDSTAVLYFTSQPTGLYVLLSGQFVPSPGQDLQSIARGYLEKGTKCRETYLQSGYEPKPVLNCILPPRYEPMENGEDAGNTTTTEETSRRPIGQQVYRQNITHASKIQVFRKYVKFQFLADGLKRCAGENEQNLNCVVKVSVDESAVNNLMNEMGIGYSNIVRGNGEEDKETLYYWMEGVVTFSNTTVVPIFAKD